MTVAGISTAQQNTTTLQNTATTKKDTERSSNDYEDFLLLLTTQLRNQDPLQPLDSTTFVSQLAEFSNVEQQIKMNTKLDSLVSSLTASDFQEANSFLGKYVSINDGKTQIKENDKETSFFYQTTDDVKSTKAIIKDRFNKVVHEINLPLAPKGTTHEWNLLNDKNEKIKPDLYNITIQTINDEGIKTEIVAQTKAKILQANKTTTGFEFITDTGKTISQNEIQKIHL